MVEGSSHELTSCGFFAGGGGGGEGAPTYGAGAVNADMDRDAVEYAPVEGARPD